MGARRSCGCVGRKTISTAATTTSSPRIEGRHSRDISKSSFRKKTRETCKALAVRSSLCRRQSPRHHQSSLFASNLARGHVTYNTVSDGKFHLNERSDIVDADTGHTPLYIRTLQLFQGKLNPELCCQLFNFSNFFCRLRENPRRARCQKCW